MACLCGVCFDNLATQLNHSLEITLVTMLANIPKAFKNEPPPPIHTHTTECKSNRLHISSKRGRAKRAWFKAHVQ